MGMVLGWLKLTAKNASTVLQQGRADEMVSF
jgi:hypothetical protein